MIRAALCVALLCLLAGTAAAQFGRGPRVPPRYPTADTFGQGFVFCRGIYTIGRREAGGSGWSTDYPDAERNFSIRFGELTRARVKRTLDGEPDYVTVPITSDWLYECPYLHLEDVGTATFTPAEVLALRKYLLKGGFIWADDFWGSDAWRSWEYQLSQVLPPNEYPIRDVDLDHSIFRSQFVVTRFPQIPSIQHWRSYNGTSTSERGSDSDTPHVRAVFDQSGNIMVFITHNTDISDAWEREAEDPDYFYRFSPDGYAVGINVMLYAMSH